MTKAVELTLLGGTLQFTVRTVEPPIAMMTVTFDNFTITARGDAMAYTLPADKEVKVQVSYVDANGNAAKVDGDVTWASSNESVARVFSDSEDTFTAVIAPGEDIGQVQISATVDADLGDGTRELVTLMDLTVVGGEAVAGTIAPVGAPEDIPHPEPQA